MWPFKKRTASEPSDIETVSKHLKSFYKLAPHEDFYFLNQNGHVLHKDRKVEKLTFAVRETVPPIKKNRYSLICRIVYSRYRPVIGSDLARVRIWDSARNVWAGGNRIPKKPDPTPLAA